LKDEKSEVKEGRETNMVATANHNVLYIWKWLKEEALHVLPTKNDKHVNQCTF
jgi:hypothetical protein